MTRTPGFEFPPLGNTGEGDPVYPTGYDGLRRPEWPTYWAPDTYTGYYVTYQLDRPACAFRCHYPGGSAPCDQDTADAFIEWAKNR